MADELPALLQHCQVIYDAMMNEAETGIDGEPPHTWRGMLTKLFIKLDYGTPNYSRIVKMLRTMGCIEQVRRGSGTAESVWLLWQPPNLDLFKWVKEQEAGGELEDEGKVPLGSSLEQRIRDMNTSLLSLRDQVNSLNEQVGLALDISDEVEELRKYVKKELELLRSEYQNAED